MMGRKEGRGERSGLGGERMVEREWLWKVKGNKCDKGERRGEEKIMGKEGTMKGVREKRDDWFRGEEENFRNREKTRITKEQEQVICIEGKATEGGRKI